MYNPPTAPLSIGGVLEDGFRLLKACFTKVLPLALLYGIAGVAPSLLIPTAEPGAAPAMSAGLVVVFLLVWLLSLVFFGAMAGSVEAIAKRSSISIFAALELGFLRVFSLLGCFILVTLAMMVGGLLLVVPGLILMVTLSMAPYLVITESMGPLESLKASHRLVWGNWWRTATILIVILFIIFVPSVVVGMLSGAGASMGMAGGGTDRMIPAAIAALTNAVLIPLYYAFGLALLHDLQLRKLGDDRDQPTGAIEGA